MIRELAISPVVGQQSSLPRTWFCDRFVSCVRRITPLLRAPRRSAGARVELDDWQVWETRKKIAMKDQEENLVRCYRIPGNDKCALYVCSLTLLASHDP